MPNISNTAKGITWQYFAVAGLMRFNNKTVAKFVKTIYNDEIFCVEKNTKKLKKTTLQKLGVFKRHHFDIISILNQYRINIEMMSLFFNIESTSNRCCYNIDTILK